MLEAADAVRARARAEGIGEREVFDADGRDFDWGMLERAFHAPSLFSARRLVEVRLPTANRARTAPRSSPISAKTRRPMWCC